MFGTGLICLMCLWLTGAVSILTLNLLDKVEMQVPSIKALTCISGNA
jgi:hypothetical protein